MKTLVGLCPEMPVNHMNPYIHNKENHNKVLILLLICCGTQNVSDLSITGSRGHRGVRFNKFNYQFYLVDTFLISFDAFCLSSICHFFSLFLFFFYSEFFVSTPADLRYHYWFPRYRHVTIFVTCTRTRNWVF